MNLKFLKSRSGLALAGASGLIAAAAYAGTTVVSHAATPSPSTPTVQSSPAAPAEKPETLGTEAPAGTEAKGAAEPAGESALPSGGHADEATGAAESNADHQFDGVE